MKLSVVIPAYNEEQDIEKAVLDVANTFDNDVEIIVVNDASTDKTLEILERLKIEHLIDLKILTNEVNKGHGYSVLLGLWNAQGDSILYVDADRQIELSNVNQIPKENLFLYDVISGQRVHRNDKLFRKITSICLRYTILCRHRMFIKDSNCPFKIYKRESLRAIIDKVPKTHIIPIACLEVIARKEGMLTGIIDTPHKPYEGTRQGFLQLPNKQFFLFISKAFMEIVKL